MARSRNHEAGGDAEAIVREAFAAFGRGVGRVRVHPTAIETFRGYFIPRICAALEQPDWREAWRREKAYVIAYAETMGRRAAKLAAADRRGYLVPGDVHDARAKMLGYMPVAGRWCPS